ncbi:MAG: PAS domain-containing protein, partial [Hyphomicrobiales bacterium]|nr:PAS domain-containing protein [Hyphomicrobiales bacterium]
RWIRYDQHRAPDGKKIFVRTDVTNDRNATESFRLLFENNPVPMWVVEKSTLRFIDINAAAIEHYGYSREQFLKMASLDIRPPS